MKPKQVFPDKKGLKASLTVDFTVVDKIIKKHHSQRSSVIAMLFDIQNTYKYLPKEALVHMSKELQIPLIDLYSIATFYKAFSLTPRGRHSITLCLGTACHVRGAIPVLEELQRVLNVKPGGTSQDGEFTLETVNCVGACTLGPTIMADNRYYGHMSPAKVEGLLKEVKS